jgi:hypothetical protein
MPLVLTAGISKKQGLPGYSSVGAICHVELELDNNLIQETPEAFRAKVREIYLQCAASVDEELARHQAHRNPTEPAGELTGESIASANGSGGVDSTPDHGDHSGNGHANGRLRLRPTARQIEFVQRLAGRLGMDAERLDGLCQRLFEKAFEDLSGREASGLIQALQEMREGWLGPDAIYRTERE